jgi:S1-C subfamily serine protease
MAGCILLAIILLPLLFAITGRRTRTPDSPIGNTPLSESAAKTPAAKTPTEKGPGTAAAQIDVAQLVAEVDPAVVTIHVTVAGAPGKTGSGFIVDSSGLVATNWHVVEGSMWAHVILADKGDCEVSGFLACSPGKDLALLKIDPGTRHLPTLRIAQVTPAKGEKVYAFGAPLGLSGSVSDGMVAAVRHGQEMRDFFQELAGEEIYVRVLRYDLDADWIQTTAPISHGNSGGPLVNTQGEVIGMNTMGPPIGQNLNFAVSAAHVRDLVLKRSGTPRPLSDIPRRRSE